MKIGIYGYGNLGRGVELAVNSAPDMELFGIFTRRDPSTVKSVLNTAVYSANDVLKYKDEIDVMIICGGSATDLPFMTPDLAQNFNVVDSFDTHANISSHFENVDKTAKSGKKVAVISVGWDPGMFSVARIYSSAILPNGKDNTFWGRGVSQGHSDAIRRIKGVIDARQYTVPVEETLNKVRNGDMADLTARQKHIRECFVVVEDGADKKEIEKEIKEMPNYFADYDTFVTFISAEEMKENHSSLPHGGLVIRNGFTGKDNENSHTIEYRLKLDSNPEFTGSVLVAYARAAKRMNDKGDNGCKTAFDIAPALLSPLSAEELRHTLL
ncbi:MAG: diaminopimelate dehydrogenase [Clostridia bacterium]|nr:diaminopimelate dehydrogenase [Clostridia bacterium]